MAGKTLGLVGFGAIAQALAQKAAALEMKVLSFDPFVRPELFHKHRVRSVSLDEILEQSDVLSVHVPLTPETRNLIGPKEIGKMRPHAILINTARGGIVNESALLEALASGKLAGAGLDVFAQEPPSKDNPLFGLANVILTPHVACFSETSMDEMHTRAIQHVVDVLGGEDDRS
jgi:D-3-phosphoglycerate dehydrogenase